MTRQELFLEARGLSSEDRLALAMELWELADEPQVSDEHRRELDRRISADDFDTSPAQPWDELRSELLQRKI